MENDKIPSDDDNVTKTLNNSFSDFVQSLDISEYTVDDTFHQNKVSYFKSYSGTTGNILVSYVTKYSRIDLVKFVDDSL